MKKLKDYIDNICETGKLPRGFTPYMIILLMKIYNDLLLYGKTTFVNDEICKILNRFGIHTKEYGIGYLAMLNERGD